MEKSVAKFTLLALPLFALTACQDYEPFSEAEVHEHFVHKNFNDSFVNTFGEIAPDHNWGFDFAEAAMTGNQLTETRALLNGEESKLVWKQDMNYVLYDGQNSYPAYIPVCELFGKPANITQNEHDEVYAWFSNHKVNWKNDLTNSNVNAVESRLTTDGPDNGKQILAHVIDSNNPNYGTLVNYDNPIYDDYVDINEIHFFNGWIQHVAYDPKYDEVAEDGISKYSGSNMDFLAFRHVSQIEDFIHLKDYNAANGYGWGRQLTSDPNNGSGQNAILVIDAKFDVVTYGCSADGSNPHNKYYIVHLKGVDYDGYYLGMDLEGFDPDAAASNNLNKNVKADGICNDWIIKIGDAGAKPYNPTRVMCEDLAMDNCDYDYNDIVYDVEYQNNVATVTVRAAGGTVPISMWFNGSQLKKADKNGTLTEEIHTLFDAPITTPVNVGSPGVTKTPIVFKMKFNTSNFDETYHNGQANVKYDFYTSDKFDFQKIQVKVKHSIEAEWVNLGNIDGQAPIRFCVPNTVKWTKELQGIEKAYPGFRAWVGNPTDMFWTSEKTINSEYLYN